MAEHSGYPLPYGQFGRPEYDIDNKTWHFDRQPKSGDTFTLLEEITIVNAPPSLNDEPHSTNKNGLPGRRYAGQISDMTKSLPDIFPATGLIASELSLSETVQATTERFDPSRGDLLAFGNIVSEAAKRLVHVAAFAGGLDGGELHVVEVKSRKEGWADANDAWIDVPVIRGDHGFWKTPGSPIQQICFAQTGDENQNLLAVRTSTCTTIFRPIIRKMPLRTSSVSRMDINPLMGIPLLKTGGIPHADVSFNPFYSPQFAIVDQTGSWTIFEIEGRNSRTIKCLTTSAAYAKQTRKPLDDGWSRIIWCGGPTVACIGTRRHLTFVDATAELPVERQKIEFTSWILDLILLPSQSKYVCLLTSTHVEIYGIDLEDGIFNSVTKVLHWGHFRSTDDLSLRLSVVQEADGFSILLQSSRDPNVAIFRVRAEQDKLSIVSDPTHFGLPSAVSNSSDVHLSAKLLPIRYGTNQSRGITKGTIAEYYRKGVRFYCFTSLRSNFSLQQALYAAVDCQFPTSNLQAPTRHSKLAVAATQYLKREQFIVDDGDFDDEEPKPDTSHGPLTHLPYRISRSNYGSRVKWTIGFLNSAQQINDEGLLNITSIAEALELAEMQLLESQVNTNVPLKTLRDFAGGEIGIADIDDVSSRMQNLLMVQSQVSTTDELDRLKLRKLPLSTWSIFQEPSEELNLLNVYDRLVQDWISPLQNGIAGRVRLAKEKALRRTAADLTLAMHVLQNEDPKEKEEVPLPESSQFELPLRRAESPTPSSPSIYVDASSQVHSQRSFHSATSNSVAPSVVSSSTRSTTLLVPRIARMKRYTTFSTPPVPLPRSLETVLSHWEPGSDPADYDWLAMTRHVSRRRDEEDEEELDERDRAKLQRRAERHLRRQRREAAASQAAQLASSQAPVLLSASQPSVAQHPPRTEPRPAGFAGAASSSQPGMMPASQVVPGKFGGRPPKKKKRKQGF